MSRTSPEMQEELAQARLREQMRMWTLIGDPRQRVEMPVRHAPWSPETDPQVEE